MARKTLKAGLSGEGAGCLLFLATVPWIVGFGVSAVVFLKARADGGADSSWGVWFGILGMVVTVVIATTMVVGLVRGRREVTYFEVFAGLQDWTARHRWEVTEDLFLANQWATRFHFSEDALIRPLVAARGWVHGRDAMVLFCMIGTEDSTQQQTIIVVDADADYPVTAVVRHRSASALSRAYGRAVPLESIEFERRWRAMGSDAAGSHAIFTPRVIERLLEPTPGSQPEIVWDGPGIRAADAGFISEPMHLESRLLLLADLAGLTPAYQVTHANDDPSFRPYAFPPAFYITGKALALQMLGVLTWAVGIMVLAPFLQEIWVVPVSVVVGYMFFRPGVRLERLEKERRMSEWHAAQASALGPPSTERQPPAP